MSSIDATNTNAAEWAHGEQDLGPLAWVLDELRKSLDGAAKAMRRFVRDAELARESDLASLDAGSLRIARQQLHQACGALEMVGMAPPALLLRAMESAVQRFVQRPEQCSDEAAAVIERASFALIEYLESVLAGKHVSPVALFPQYRDAQNLVGAERVHPADLWPAERRLREPHFEVQAEPLPYGAPARARLDSAVLRVVKSADPIAAAEMRETCLGFVAAQPPGPVRTFWKIGAGFFDAMAQQLLPSDLYVKRVASRVLLQYATLAKGDDNLADRLVQDLLFFCAQAAPAAGQAPVLHSVRETFNLGRYRPVDYEKARFGRFDPALLAQARKRIAAATETWSALAGGDRAKIKPAADQFSLVCDSLTKLMPGSEPLAQAMTKAMDSTSRSGEPPSAALAMEVATAVLYLQATFDDLDTSDESIVERATRLSQRLDQVLAGADSAPLEPWMEELYRRVSDRQTMGSVVDELRVTLAEAEKALDQFFRNSEDLSGLNPVPGHLGQMRGVLSVLGLDQASLAVARMRETVERLLLNEVSEEERPTVFEKLGNSLGALGFLIDMLSYQRAMARKLFVYDEELGELRILMGRVRPRSDDSADEAPVHVEARAEMPVPNAVLHPVAAEPLAPVVMEPAATPELQAFLSDAAAEVAPAPAVPEVLSAPEPAPAASPIPETQDEADDELLEIFLEEAREVVVTGLAAVEALNREPGDLSEQTTLRRAFHTLKGSSRMVGLNEFGEAGWAMEQMLNAWLAEQKAMPAPMLGLAGEALHGFGHWADAIAQGTASGWLPEPFRIVADAMRLNGARMPLVLPGMGLMQPTVEPVVPTAVPEEPVAAELPVEAGATSDDVPVAELPEALLSQEEVFEPSFPADSVASVEPDFVPTEAGALQPEHAPAVDILLPEAEKEFDFSQLGTMAFEVSATPAPAETTVAENVQSIDLGSFDLSFPETEAPPSEGVPSADAAPSELLDNVHPGAVESTAGDALPWPDDFVLEEVSLEVPALPVEEAPVHELVEEFLPPELAVDPEVRVEELTAETSVDEVSAAVPEMEAAPASEESLALDISAMLEEPSGIAEEIAEAPTEVVESAAWGPQEVAALADMLPEPIAQTETLPEAAETESVKVIGSLRIALPLYNVYLNEADEWSRRLESSLQEWANAIYEPVPDTAVALAHSLAGSSATVGFLTLSEMARTLEHTLQHVQLQSQGLPSQAQTFVAAAEDVRRQLHQFAAGFLKEPNPQILEELREIQSMEIISGMMPLEPDFLDSLEQHAVEEVQPVAASVTPEVSTFDDADRRVDEAIAQAMARASELDDDIDVFDTIDPDLFPIFEEEAVELLPTLGAALRQWSARPDNLTARSEVLRALHTLKGSSRLAGAMRLGEMAHRLESAVESAGIEDVTAEKIDPLLAGFDGLQASFDVLRAVGLHEDAAVAETPAVIDAVAPTEPVAAVQAFAASPLAAPVRLPGAVQTQLTRTAGNQSVRVRAQLLDRLVNQAGEVMIARSRLDVRLKQVKGSLDDLSGNLDRLRQQLRDIEVQAESQMQSRLALSKDSAAGFDPLEFDRFTRVQELTRMMAESVNDVATVQRNLQRSLDGAEDDLIAQGRQARELQRDLLRTRMVEFESIAERLYAVVRQSSKETAKQIKLDIAGGTIEMDRGVLDRMTPAFEHLLRNCVAHGIELPEARVAHGKPATGTITVAVRQEGNDVSVEFRDDGAGLNVERIRAKAVEQGLIEADAHVGNAEAAQLVFMPGFSTATEVTGLAGRGIGMDVVRSEVNALGGRIETTTESGAGTSFRMVLPLTTAVTQVVMLRSGELSVGVPANLVEIVRRTSVADLEVAYRTGRFDDGKESLPFFWSGSLLQSSARSMEPGGRTRPVVIFRSASQRMAMHVDEVLGNQEIVVKNLGPQLSRLPGLAGMSVLASGAVVLVYNPVALATVYGEQIHAKEALLPISLEEAAPAASSGTAAQEKSPVKVVVNQVPLVLVVDDSITVRRVTQRLLQREGYRVSLAADGLQALERLQEERPTVVLSDIEMPRMDGFDLARNIRGDAALRDLPIIMITSRIAEKHREHAMELGVNNYLGKPYSDEELLGLLKHYVEKATALAEA
jgi:chemosensory pili system protein ChpA (sensor histidine kinase/response regulator)